MSEIHDSPQSGIEAEIDQMSDAEIRIALKILSRQYVELEETNRQLQIDHKTEEFRRLRYFDLYDNAPVGYCTLSASGVVLEANPRATQLLRLPLESLVATSFVERINEADRAAYETFYQRVLKTGAHDGLELRLKRPDELVSWVNIASTRSRDIGGEPVVRLVLTDVTERRQSAEALRQAEERLRLVVAGTRDAPWDYDLVAKTLYYSPQWWAMLGYENNEHLNDADFWRQVVHPEDEAHIDAVMKNAIDEGHVGYALEGRLRHRDGHYVHVLSRGHITRDDNGTAVRISGTNTDLTEQKRVEGERQRALDLLQKIAARVPGMVFQYCHQTDGRRHFLYVSEAIRQLYGIAPEVALQDAAPLTERLHPDDREMVRVALQYSEQTLSPWEQDYRVCLEDGRVQWLHINSVPERAADGSTVWYGFVSDVSTRKAAERHRVALEAELRESQKMQAIGTLAGGIAHDFNNIIGTILGNIALAKEDIGDNKEALQSILEVEKAGERARSLVRQILSFSRRQPVRRQTVALPPIVTDVAQMLRATLLAPLAIDFSTSTNVPNIHADSTQIGQIVLNILANAAQAMEGRQGTIKVDISSATLTAPLPTASRTLPPGDYARISISDEGHGIPEESIKRIFEPFYTTRPVGSGTGLGLSVVYGIVQAHDAGLLVNSQVGVGTTFVLYFPATSGKLDEISPPGTTIIPARNTGEMRGHILYIDDDESLLDLVERMLSRRGYKLTCHMDSTQALALLRSDPAAFDLVLTDYNMPGANGIEVAKQARSVRPDLPIALASGFITDELRTKASEAGIEHVIFKPNIVEEYCEVVDKLMRRDAVS